MCQTGSTIMQMPKQDVIWHWQGIIDKAINNHQCKHSCLLYAIRPKQMEALVYWFKCNIKFSGWYTEEQLGISACSKDKKTCKRGLSRKIEEPECKIEVSLYLMKEENCKIEEQ